MVNFMINEVLLPVYLLNTTLLIIHEIDGAYWKEWKLFGRFGKSLDDKNGLTIYLLAHIPILVILLYGLISLNTIIGLIISLILTIFLIAHLIVHIFVKKRNPIEFNSLSFYILFGTLILSLTQLPLTLYYLVR